MANVYQCTNIKENIFIYDRDMAKDQKFKIAVAAILNFKIEILGSNDTCMAHVYLQTKLVQISPEIAEIRLFMHFQYGGVAIRHVLPVLWMTSYLAVMGRTAIVALRYRGGCL